MALCMVCGVEKTASYVTGEASCSCMSPAAFDKFMKVHGEIDQLKQSLAVLVKAADAVLGNPLRYQHAEALSRLKRAVEEAEDTLHDGPFHTEG